MKKNNKMFFLLSIFLSLGLFGCNQGNNSSLELNSSSENSSIESSEEISSEESSSSSEEISSEEVSSEVKNDPIVLNTPTISISSIGLATWDAIENCSGYVYVINEGSEVNVPSTTTYVILQDGQSIKVKALGDNENYLDSEYSEVKTYTASKEKESLMIPVVSISDVGLATWDAIPNAIGYKYKIDGGEEQTLPNTTTYIVLDKNQSIQVKALGDGDNYLDSEYSEVKSYVDSITPNPTKAPTYLGITASINEPSSSDRPSFRRSSNKTTIEESINTYLSDSNNSLGESYPTPSNYSVYSSIGETVYIQIWLDNPDQNTILSLKLNGVKYQSGGGLQSFFIEDNGSYLNCVYIAVTIPNDSYKEINYEVTEIEYVEGNNINQDGKKVLIDENNDTISIGLPYQEKMVNASISNVSTTSSTISLDINIIDEDNYLQLVNGWLRVVVYDNQKNILGQHKLLIGDNSITFENLSADTSYDIMVILYGDTNDGKGVNVHSLANSYADTQSVITYESSSKILINEVTDKYYPQLIINSTLSDSSFKFTKIEICNYYQEVLYTSEFDGSISITEGILCGNDYVVKVYYENGQGIEQVYYDYAFVESLDYPYINSNTRYGLVDDGILEFEFSEGKYNLDNLKIQVYYEHSKEYIAEDALYLIENPNAIADLEALMETLDMRSEEYFNAYKRHNRLEEVQQLINECYSEVIELEWQQALNTGIYLYEFTYGTDEEFFKGANNKYYVVLSDYQTKCVDDSSWYYILSADIDESNGNDISNRTLSSGYFKINPALSEKDYLFVEYDSEQGRDLFYVSEDNQLYLQTMSRNNLGDETHRALGYVNQIVLRSYDEIIKVLWTQEAGDSSIDEAVWLEDMKLALIEGKDPHSVFPLGDLEAITFDLDSIDLKDVPAGSYYICYSYIMYGKTYTEEHPYDTDGNWLNYKVVGQLPQASININTGATDDYGNFEIEIPNSVNNGYWSYYEIEVRDASNELIGTYNQDNYGEIGRLSINYSIRIKLTVDPYNDIYVDGEWSQWFVCSPAKCDTPTNISQHYEEKGVTVTWDWVAGAEKYVYIINDGEEQETNDTSISGLKDGDIIKIKAVPSNESSYLESDYSETYTIEDTRIPLTTPIVTFNSEYQRLEWSVIENAYYYEIYDVTNNSLYRTVWENYCNLMQIGNVYIVKAIPNDYYQYSLSQSTEISTNIKLSAPEVYITNEGVVSFSEYYDVKSDVIYTYIINDGEEQTTTNPYDVVTLTLTDVIKVKVSCDYTGYIDSEWTTIKYLEKLAVPEVTVSNYTATWAAVENAVKYLYVINNGEPIETTLLKVEGLTAGERIKVCAVGDNENYGSSDYSDNITVKQKLNTPVVNVDENGLATWTFENDLSSSVLRSIRYYVVLNNNEEEMFILSEASYQLSEGDIIKVKVYYGRTNSNFEESDWSIEKTY